MIHRIQRVLHMLSIMTLQVVAFSIMIVQCHLLQPVLWTTSSSHGPGSYYSPGLRLDLLSPLLFLAVSLPVVQAQSELGAAGAFNTSVLGALYGLGLAAVSIERFPVANLTWTSELWARLTGMTVVRVGDFSTSGNGRECGSKSGTGSKGEDGGTQAQAAAYNPHRTNGTRSEIMQLRWLGGECSSWTRWTRWSAYASPYPLFNELGAHHVVIITNGPDKRATFTGGAWVCVDEATAVAISGRHRALPPLATSCGGYHYWASNASWWLAVRLKPFTAEVDGKTLNHTGCLEYTRSIDGATAQAEPAPGLPLKVEYLRYTPNMNHYNRMDRPGYLNPNFSPTARTMMSLLTGTDKAIVSTQEVHDMLGTIWECLAPTQGKFGGERELDMLVHSSSLIESEDPHFYFRTNFTRIAPSSAVIPHLIETAVTLILPWFGVTSLVIIEQISRKVVWSSLSTGSSRYVHASAYGGEIMGLAANPCSYLTLDGGPTIYLFWFISGFRLLLTLGSYAAAIWVQVSLKLKLPTHDDVLSTQAARGAGTAAAIVHVVTTMTLYVLIGRARPVFGPLLAAVFMMVIIILEWCNVLSALVVGPVILAAEFISSVVQTTLSTAVDDAVPLEGWRHTVGAVCSETRIALILAIPRLVAWFRVTAK